MNVLLVLSTAQCVSHEEISTSLSFCGAYLIGSEALAPSTYLISSLYESILNSILKIVLLAHICLLLLVDRIALKYEVTATENIISDAIRLYLI